MNKPDISVNGKSTSRILEQGRGAEGALIGYLPVGFPDLETSIQSALAMVDAGVKAIEFGLPYTDPVMDGVVIQQAVDAALKNGTRVRDVLTAVEQVANTGTPTVVMTYWNPIMRYGVNAWSRDLAAAGGSGLVTADLIPDEADEWMSASDEYDLGRIFLVAPSSTQERLEKVAAATRGFVYAASTMGVTGARPSVGVHAHDLVDRTRAAGAPYVAVGVGVSTPDQASEVARYADGVIVGSVFVRALIEAESTKDGPAAVGAIARSLVEGVRAGTADNLK